MQIAEGGPVKSTIWIVIILSTAPLWILWWSIFYLGLLLFVLAEDLVDFAADALAEEPT